MRRVRPTRSWQHLCQFLPAEVAGLVVDRTPGPSYRGASMTKPDQALEIPVGVSLTHDKGHPVIFAYVGGKGPLGMRAKRFNPRVIGSVERALKQAIRWRKQALREHTAAVAALPPRSERKTVGGRRKR